MMLGHFQWDCDRIFFTIPYINHPITWYGLFFATGFLIGFFLIRRLFFSLVGDKEGAHLLADRITLSIIICSVIGSRLGHVFFYEWSYYKSHLFDIFKVWEGGLASHGGTVGAFVGLAIFLWWAKRKYKELNFFCVLDALVIPTAFVAGMIRLGNFANQEIVGLPSTLPWAVTFAHPADGPAGTPLHPAQLYESLVYFFTFALLFGLWKARATLLGRGLLSGLFFLLVFGSRFFIEFVKPVQSEFVQASGSSLRMGQWLSLPFVGLGIILLVHYLRLALSSPHESRK